MLNTRLNYMLYFDTTSVQEAKQLETVVYYHTVCMGKMLL